MKYENPVIEEGINYSKEHPLREFWELIAGVTIAILVVLILLNTFAGALAKRVPFQYEQALVEKLDAESLVNDLQGDDTETVRTQIEIVNKLEQQLLSVMDLPPEVKVQVHYSGGDLVNALAFLGGNVYLFEGLISRLETEQELAAVMAHEIAHIKLRHPITALGKGVGIAILAASVSGASGSSAGEILLGSSANLTMLKFSRDQELAADLEAARAIEAIYGHVQGFDGLFSKFEALESEHQSNYGSFELFNSHPFSENRWARLKSQAVDQGWPLSGVNTPLKFPE